MMHPTDYELEVETHRDASEGKALVYKNQAEQIMFCLI